jgi:hypothetical protein
MNHDCIFCSHVGECNYTPVGNEVMPNASDIDEFCRDGGQMSCNRFMKDGGKDSNEYHVRIEVMVHVHAPDQSVAVMQALTSLRNEGFCDLTLLGAERRGI